MKKMNALLEERRKKNVLALRLLLIARVPWAPSSRATGKISPRGIVKRSRAPKLVFDGANARVSQLPAENGAPDPGDPLPSGSSPCVVPAQLSQGEETIDGGRCDVANGMDGIGDATLGPEGFARCPAKHALVHLANQRIVSDVREVRSQRTTSSGQAQHKDVQ